MNHIRKFNESISEMKSIDKVTLTDIMGMEHINYSNDVKSDFQHQIDDYEKAYNQFNQLYKQSNLDKILPELEQKIKMIKIYQSRINPKIYIAKHTERNGEKIYHGKTVIYDTDGTKKMITVFVGKISDFESPDDVLEVAKKKILQKINQM